MFGFFFTKLDIFPGTSSHLDDLLKLLYYDTCIKVLSTPLQIIVT